MRPTLDELFLKGYLTELDKQFADTMARLTGDDAALSVLGAAVASRFTTQGHVCADIHELAGSAVETPEGETLDGMVWPDAEPWLAALRKSPMVRDSRQSDSAPLVLDDDGRLYLYRYWRYQLNLARALTERAGDLVETVDQPALESGLQRLFQSDSPTVDDGPERAARTAVTRRLTVIIGGPGTGKTFTVQKIIALLLEQAAALGLEPPRISMMAPTGKAAARLTESIQRAKNSSLDCSPSIRAAIPEQATTIQRALQARVLKPTQFHYHKDNPLKADIVVVDEASMIDLPLMTALIDAVMPKARLILLGDKDQLTSVGAGAVLGDICQPPPDSGDTSPHAQEIKHCIVPLEHNYRFGQRSGIFNLARAINQGEANAALDCLENDGFNDVALVELPTPLTVRRLEYAIQPFVEPYQAYLQQPTPKAQLARFNGFRILSPHRQGIVGVNTLNRLAETRLEEQGHFTLDRDWYVGRPILVTQNDYQIGLFNGDVGIVGRASPGSSELRVYFDDTDDQPRSLTLARMPSCETVFAMTIHKSQGSEFDRVVVVLPEKASPVVTRELLYTAVTRARKQVTLIATKEAVQTAIGSKLQRTSGLSRLLWHGSVSL